ncbi:VOC family protein [Rhodococcus sp. NPDC059234]|uniref:VOC family protein n=1 Tax=Rhodococcus sp. NPDC059234 TaxID=3346781 RepID=UPI003672D0E0
MPGSGIGAATGRAGIAVARVGSITLDCDEPASLASFWCEILGREVARASDKCVTVIFPRGMLTAIRVADYRAPSRPDSTVPKQIHRTSSWTTWTPPRTRRRAWGARVAFERNAPDVYRVLLDPAGHSFCLRLPRGVLCDA